MTNGKTRQAKFTLKSGAKFDLEEVTQVLAPRYSGDVTVLTAPPAK